ncbi:MAG: ATP synthase F1 subunit gamma [Bdellovibrionales bacterium]|nr:ATP synthase F1 subunit gamma [Bdellovibrionales bacterium]
MAGLKKIRSRISSVKNTEQITQAMKMVAAARLKKAQMRILNLRPYAENILSVMADVALSCNIRHPLLEKKEKMKKILLVVLTSDRGLCGGFNNNICRFAENFYHSQKEKDLGFFFIGKKAKNYFRFRGIPSVGEMFQLDREISYPLAGKVAHQLMNNFSDGKYDGIYFIYNSFQSVISQKVIKETFLPIDISEAPLVHQNQFSRDMIFETPPEELLEDLIEKHFTVQVYRCMCESVAAEYGARMSSMDNATRNAQDIVSRLTLTFNKMRQSAITTELIEVSSGAEAMKG